MHESNEQRHLVTSPETEDERYIRDVTRDISERLLENQERTGYPLFCDPIALASDECEIARAHCELHLRTAKNAKTKSDKENAERDFLDWILLLGAAKIRRNRATTGNPREDLESSISKTVEMLVQKNREYGSAVFKKGAVFSRATAEDAIRTRLDDKMSRLEWMLAHPGEASIEEDTEFDVTGYLILMHVARRKTQEGGS